VKKKSKSSPSADSNNEKVETPVADETPKYTAQEKKALRNEITHKLRFEILERDAYTCKYCGKSPMTHKGTVLTVDHIKPLEAGGGNDPDNLVCACFECNEGKKQKRLALNPFNPDDPDNVKEVTDKDMSALIDKDSIVPVEKIGTKEEIKAYFLGDASKKNRDALYAYYGEESKDCPKDCAMCTDVDDKYLSCFKYLREWAGRTAAPDTARANVNPMDMHMQCDSCYLVGRCPKYKVGAECAFNFGGDVDFTDVKTAMQIIVNTQRDRVMRGSMFERVDGGALDKNVTGEIQLLLDMMSRLDDRGTPKLKIEASGAGGVSLVAGILQGMIKPRQDALPPSQEVKQLQPAQEIPALPEPP